MGGSFVTEAQADLEIASALPGVDWLQEGLELGEGRESLPHGSNDL